MLCRALQAFELRLWPEQHPLRQFEQQLPFELLRKLEDRQLSLDMLAVSMLAKPQREGWARDGSQTALQLSPGIGHHRARLVQHLPHAATLANLCSLP